MPPAAVGRPNQGDSISDFYKEMPLVTKVLTTGTVLTAALVSFGMVSDMDMVFVWQFVAKKFHVWRLLTSFTFVGPFSFSFVMHTFVLYENCRRYEQNPFNTGGGGNSSDFLLLVLFAMVALVLVNFVFPLQVMSECLLYAIMYVWSRREPDARLNLWGFQFKGLYCPWVYIGIRVLMGGSPTQPVIGVVVGHVYYFLVEVLPLSHGYDLVRTPAFCVDLVQWYTGVTGASAGGGTGFVMQPPPARAGAAAGAGGAGAAAAAGAGGANRAAAGGAGGSFPSMGAGHQWGRGRTLGTQ